MNSLSKGSPFYVETQLGKLELTKGAYLTLQKRKASTLRTLTKTKPINKNTPKSTLKRFLRNRQIQGHSLPHVAMLNKKGEEVNFLVVKECEQVKQMIGSLPSIEMGYDNDAESEWC